MLPKVRLLVEWVVYVWFQLLDGLLVCNYSCLIEFIHAFENLNVDKSLVVNDGKKAVLVDDFLGNDKDVYLHILRVG